MPVTFKGDCTFQERDDENKVTINTVDGVHYARCECGNKWESKGIPKTVCDKCNKDTQPFK